MADILSMLILLAAARVGKERYGHPIATTSHTVALARTVMGRVRGDDGKWD